MSPDQVRNVANVYRRLMLHEEGRGWTKLDDDMAHLSYLDDDELVREAEVAFCHHDGKNPRCPKDHDIRECFIPTLIDAVTAILDLYRETENLHVNNRYVIECYLAIDQQGSIVAD